MNSILFRLLPEHQKKDSKNDIKLSDLSIYIFYPLCYYVFGEECRLRGNVSEPQPMFWTDGFPVGQNIRKNWLFFVYPAQIMQERPHFFHKKSIYGGYTKWHKKFSL